MGRLALLALLIGTAPPTWVPGAFRGVVTGQRALDAAQREFGEPINDVVDDADEQTRRLTFRPISVQVPALDGGAPTPLELGVQLFVDRRTRRVLRIRLTPIPGIHLVRGHVALSITLVPRAALKAIVDVPFIERRYEYCEASPFSRDGITSDGEPGPWLRLLAPDHGLIVQVDDRFLGDLVFSATPPDWFTAYPCPSQDVSSQP